MVGLNEIFVRRIIVIWIAGLWIYFPIQFIVYEPYFDIEWKEGKWAVIQTSNYNFFDFQEDDGGDKHYFDYTVYKVILEVDDKRYHAFGWGSTNAKAKSGWSTDNGYSYPYEYFRCFEHKECQGQYFLPVWYWNECELCDDFVTGEYYDCSYHLHSGYSDISDISDLPDGYNPEYITEYNAFIEVTIDHDAYYDYDDYVALQVVVLGFMVVLPSLIAVIVFLKMIIKKVSDWMDREPEEDEAEEQEERSIQHYELSIDSEQQVQQVLELQLADPQVEQSQLSDPRAQEEQQTNQFRVERQLSNSLSLSEHEMKLQLDENQFISSEEVDLSL